MQPSFIGLTPNRSAILMQTRMTANRCFGIAVIILVQIATFGFAGCTKKTAYAIVLGKEHIPAAPLPTPSPESSATAAPTESPQEPKYVERELAADEIEVGSHIMKKADRGTIRDPRALSNEQWLVEVRLVENNQHMTVHTDRVHYEKVREGDRIKVRYSQGNYTGSIWATDIED